MFNREPSPQIGRWLKRFFAAVVFGLVLWFGAMVLAIAWLISLGAQS